MMNNTTLSKLFSAVHEALLGIDGSTIVFANPAADSLFGTSLTGTAAKDVLPRELLETTADSFVMATEIMGIEATVSVLREDGLTLLFIERMQAEAFLYPISRRIVSSLRGNAMGLKMAADHCFSRLEDGKQPKEQHISMLYHYYYRLLRTITQVDSAASLESGDILFSPVSTDLIKLCSDITDTVSSLRSGSDASISFTCSESELTAVVDPERIEQLLLNLLSNSLKHTTAGDHITVSLRRTGESIILSVDDDGDGIPQYKLSRLFKMPVSEQDLTNPDNSGGLGLYISFSIARLHKGVLLIESREGEGTHVRVMLPIDNAPAPKFSTPGVAYHRSGISSVLTGLAEVLGSDCYGPKFED